MQILVVSAPGPGESLHWSVGVARQVVELAVGSGADALWLCAVPEGVAPPDVPEWARSELFLHPVLPRKKVEKANLDAPLERALSLHLRAHPAAPVLHVGLGAQGSPNVLWLAERLGSRAVAAVRGDELVCHRGDLVDRDGAPCRDWSDPERCRWCCEGRSGRPRGDEFRNRIDLLFAGLSTAAAVHVPTADDVPFLSGLGVDEARVRVGVDADALWGSLAPGPLA